MVQRVRPFDVVLAVQHLVQRLGRRRRRGHVDRALGRRRHRRLRRRCGRRRRRHLRAGRRVRVGRRVPAALPCPVVAAATSRQADRGHRTHRQVLSPSDSSRSGGVPSHTSSVFETG
ncbi:hypothetical protein BRD17_01150 [Halobacteriales archaeon SW_7_68_16]|nr:MAG: hypothetical protein BRD17_01150 [Halobacteriales archaeon SW_7_68_16]